MILWRSSGREFVSSGVRLCEFGMPGILRFCEFCESAWRESGKTRRRNGKSRKAGGIRSRRIRKIWEGGDEGE